MHVDVLVLDHLELLLDLNRLHFGLELLLPEHLADEYDDVPHHSDFLVDLLLPLQLGNFEQSPLDVPLVLLLHRRLIHIFLHINQTETQLFRKLVVQEPRNGVESVYAVRGLLGFEELL